jgi:hypothetical protein
MKLYVEELEARNVYSVPVIPKPVAVAVQVEQAFDMYIASLDQDASDAQQRVQSLPVVNGQIRSTPVFPVLPSRPVAVLNYVPKKEVALAVNYTPMFTKPVVKFEFSSVKLSR